jgi:lipoprotein signal peptidase
MKISLVITLGLASLSCSLISRSRDVCISNSGFAFGLNFPLFEIFSILIVLLLIIIYMKKKSDIRYNILGLAILGLINISERLIFGNICDYITILKLSFNLVDIAIVVNVLIILYSFLKDERDSSK